MLNFLKLNAIRRAQSILSHYLKQPRSQRIISQCRHQVTYNVAKFHSVSTVRYAINTQEVNTKLEDLLKSFKETEHDLSSLLQLCGKLLSKEHPLFRAKLCENLWTNAKKSVDKLTLDQHHMYIQICTENEVLLNGMTFLETLAYEPSIETYRLLIENNSALGNVDGAFELVADMKYKKYAIDKNIFDSLVLGHTLNSGIQGGEEVINTMTDAQLNVDLNTYWNVLRGLCTRNNQQEFEEFLQNRVWDVVDNYFLDCLLRLGCANNQLWLPKLKEQVNLDVLPRFLMKGIENVCIQLISRRHPEAAMFIYSQLIDHRYEEKYAAILQEEMLRQQIDTQTIIKLSTHIKEKNPFVLENLLLCAFKNKYDDAAWKFIENLEVLRPHYFWPFLTDAGDKSGEKGILEVLKRMTTLNVKVDEDTLEHYCLPFCDKSNPQHLTRKFESLKVDLKILVSSLIIVLLKEGQIASAAELCEHYDLVLSGERMLNILATIWFNTKKSELVLKILQKICESNPNNLNAAGVFILKATKLCRQSADMDDLLTILKLIDSKMLRISSGSYDNIVNVLQYKSRNCDYPQEIEATLEKLLDVAMTQDVAHIKHPRDMSVDDMENHLIELEAKEMETRGLLRKLIIEHCRLGNSDRVKELQEKFISSGYKETAGIKGVMLHNYLESNHLNQALEVYDEIKTMHPNFNIDDFKIINLATLLIKNDKFAIAMDIIQKESEQKLINGGKAIERNCWKLLSAIEEPTDVREAFDLLIKLGYCKPSNIILGPLVKLHLKRNDLESAISEYKIFANKYNCTPLQLELMLQIVKNERSDLLQECLDVTSKIHGIIRTRVTLLAAFAENQMQGPITKLLMESQKIPRHELNKRYERWIVEDKLYALETMANAAKKLPTDVINLSDIHLAITKIFSMKNDCESAVKFWMDLVDNEIMMTDEVHHQIISLLERCKYELPKSLLKG